MHRQHCCPPVALVKDEKVVVTSTSSKDVEQNDESNVVDSSAPGVIPQTVRIDDRTTLDIVYSNHGGKEGIRSTGPTFLKITPYEQIWKGSDTTTLSSPNTTHSFPLTVHWRVSRTRGTGLFSCTCGAFKKTGMIGTFIETHHGVFGGARVFSESDEYDRMDRAYDFGNDNLGQCGKGYRHCEHISKVIVHLCEKEDAALAQLG